MESLFRFVLVRPPREQDPDRPSIELAQASSFQRRLATALRRPDPRPVAIAVARQFVASDTFVGTPEQIDLAESLAALDTSLAELDTHEYISRSDVLAAIQSAFGQPANEVIANDSYQQSLARVRDSIVAIKYVQEEHRRPIHILTNQLRSLELVVRVASDESFPSNVEALRGYRARSLRLPTEKALTSILSSAALEEERRKQAEETAARERERVEALLERYRGLAHVVDELSALGAAHLHFALARLTRMTSVRHRSKPTMP